MSPLKVYVIDAYPFPPSDVTFEIVNSDGSSEGPQTHVILDPKEGETMEGHVLFHGKECESFSVPFRCTPDEVRVGNRGCHFPPQIMKEISFYRNGIILHGVGFIAIAPRNVQK